MVVLLAGVHVLDYTVPDMLKHAFTDGTWKNLHMHACQGMTLCPV